MTKLMQTAVVETPFVQAADLVENYLVGQADSNGDITLRLAAPGACVCGRCAGSA